MKPKLLLTLTALLALADVARAQGTAFTYQGRLNDNGSPAHGNYDLAFAVCSGPTGLNLVSSVLTNSATPVGNGLFTVTLNFGPDVFDGSARWLLISVRTNGGGAFSILSPRQPLAAAPYAIMAGGVSGSVSAAQLSGTIAPANIGAGTVTSGMLAAGSVTTSNLANGAVSAQKLSTLTAYPFSITFANPTPESSEEFGSAVAALGTDRVLIGAQRDNTGTNDAGAAYLFSTNGTLLTTFTNPTPQTSDNFGSALAVVGTDKVLIGAYGHRIGGGFSAGAAYLFNTNGILLTTFTDPTPMTGDYFGYTVAALGPNRVLISAMFEDAINTNDGSAYLFNLNGNLITTFTNLAPAWNGNMGNAMAALGSDRVVIAARGTRAGEGGATNSGLVYLFNTNGTLLTTITNPTPADHDNFGWAVAAVGTDKVLITAPYDDTAATNAGMAYLFNTNGTLLTTITSPTPAMEEDFGIAVAVLGTDQVLIAARYENTGGLVAGPAYLFSTDGTLLSTLVDPSGLNGEGFGNAVAAVGNDRVLIGAYQNGTGASRAGAAYLFSPSPYLPGLISQGVAIGTITSSSVANGTIVDADISDQAAIEDIKLATIRTAGKVSDSALSPSVVLRYNDNQIFSGSNSFLGSVGIGTATPSQKLHVVGNILATGTITPNSDRNAKTGFAAVDTSDILDRVLRLPVQQWRFLAEPAGVKHLGPMAQDFREAFGLGEIPTAIATVDADGVALAAIQGLNQKLEETRAENAALKQSVQELKRLVEMLVKKGGEQ